MSKPPRHRRAVTLVVILTLFAFTVPAAALPVDAFSSVSFLARLFSEVRLELMRPGTQVNPFVAYMITQIEPNGETSPADAEPDR